jgi:hypothetical protein
MDSVESDINAHLTDIDGYLNVGRETSNGLREVYYACRDFKKSSRVTDKIAQNYKDKLKIEYDIYKDKYWKTFNRFSGM